MLGEHGALSGAEPGTTLVDMTTSQPALAVEIAGAAARGVHALDAPVSGGDVGARNAALSIMVGPSLGIALAEAERARLALPGLALAKQLYVALQAQGRGRDGTQALIHALASPSGISWPPPAAR